MATMTRFEQSEHGQSEHGQTPAGMFLERWTAYGQPEVARYRRSRKTGELIREHVSSDPVEVLRFVLGLVDGHRTSFEADDDGARLGIAAADEAGAKFVLVEFLTRGEE